MGVTIHFSGQLLGEDAFRDLISVATAYAATYKWAFEPIESEHVTLSRMWNEEEWDYSGPVKGVVLYPGEDCEPVRLEFDTNLYAQNWVKTQFAGVETHIRVVELLKALTPFFRILRVEDEGTIGCQAVCEPLRNISTQ